jgi:hypothetical protein
LLLFLSLPLFIWLFCVFCFVLFQFEYLKLLFASQSVFAIFLTSLCFNFWSCLPFWNCFCFLNCIWLFTFYLLSIYFLFFLFL